MIIETAIEPCRFRRRCKCRRKRGTRRLRILQSEICRAYRELCAGIEKYRIPAERDAGLAAFHDMAAKGGKTLREVVRRYIDMEVLVKEDLTAGIFNICENMGEDPLELCSRYLAAGKAA